jgi:hypothetical protein
MDEKELSMIEREKVKAGVSLKVRDFSPNDTKLWTKLQAEIFRSKKTLNNIGWASGQVIGVTWGLMPEPVVLAQKAAAFCHETKANQLCGVPWRSASMRLLLHFHSILSKCVLCCGVACASP